jgi:hypothetical protein
MNKYILSLGLFASLFATTASAQESSPKQRALTLLNNTTRMVTSVVITNLNTGKVAVITETVEPGGELDIDITAPAGELNPPCIYAVTVHFYNKAPLGIVEPFESVSQDVCKGLPLDLNPFIIMQG